MRASLTVFCAARISTLNIATGSQDGRPPLPPSPQASAFSSAGQNTSKSATRPIVFSASPQSDNRFR